MIIRNRDNLFFTLEKVVLSRVILTIKIVQSTGNPLDSIALTIKLDFTGVYIYAVYNSYI